MTIYFHNGELNTVKVKTSTEKKVKKRKQKVARKDTDPCVTVRNDSETSDLGLLIMAEPMQVSPTSPEAEQSPPVARTSSHGVISVQSNESNGLLIQKTDTVMEVSNILCYKNDVESKESVRAYTGPDPDDLPSPPPPLPQLASNLSTEVQHDMRSDCLEMVQYYYNGADLAQDLADSPITTHDNSSLEIVRQYRGADVYEGSVNDGEGFDNNLHLETVRVYIGADLQESLPPPPPPPVMSQKATETTSSGSASISMDFHQRSMSYHNQHQPSPSPGRSRASSNCSSHKSRTSSPKHSAGSRHDSLSRSPSPVTIAPIASVSSDLKVDDVQNKIVDLETGELQYDSTRREESPPSNHISPLTLQTTLEDNTEQPNTLSAETPPSPDYDMIGSPKDLTTGQFSFQVISADDEAAHSNTTAQTGKRVGFGSTELIPASPDGVEREYLSFAQRQLRNDQQQSELQLPAGSNENQIVDVTPEAGGRRPSIQHIVQRFNRQDSVESNESRAERRGSILERVRQYEEEVTQELSSAHQENEEPVYAVINKNRQDGDQGKRT